MTIPLNDVVPLAHCFCLKQSPVHGLLLGPLSFPPKPPEPLLLDDLSPSSPQPGAITIARPKLARRAVPRIFMCSSRGRSVDAGWRCRRLFVALDAGRQVEEHQLERLLLWREICRLAALWPSAVIVRRRHV